MLVCEINVFKWDGTEGGRGGEGGRVGGEGGREGRRGGMKRDEGGEGEGREGWRAGRGGQERAGVGRRGRQRGRGLSEPRVPSLPFRSGPSLPPSLGPLPPSFPLSLPNLGVPPSLQSSLTASYTFKTL